MLGISLGTVAVDIFFVTSGFLITSSLLNRQNILDFSCARLLRIFPALWVMLLLTIFILGPRFTNLPLPSYFADHATRSYLVRGATLFRGVTFSLPGVFALNPYRDAVNGSLWTLPYEVNMYARLALIWLVMVVTGKHRKRAFKALAVSYAAWLGVRYLALILSNGASAVPLGVELPFMFFIGSAFYILKDHIQLSRPFFFLLAGALAFSLHARLAFQITYTASLAYLVLYLAYVPSCRGLIRRYNLIGDYSYGVYIYAFPVQQSVAALIPGVSVYRMILISAPLTVLLAVLSWHVVEKPSLALNGVFADRIKRLFAPPPVAYLSPANSSQELPVNSQ
jgi:peptidoglycan/LPS O-acetylase OafA/YrhL